MYFQTLKAANSNVCGQNWLKFKLIQDIIHFLVNTCSLKRIPRINSNQEKVEKIAANSLSYLAKILTHSSFMHARKEIN